MRIAIAGATGFIGRALRKALCTEHEIVALSRKARTEPDADGITWRACNLFNLLHLERALEGCDTAFYLVHSMMPNARLTQGSFDDLDLICADNFARAAHTVGVKHIVYLGGIIPEDDRDLSVHLRSRLEVERALGSHGVPLTTLRAGMVVGASGSSFDMMVRLVRRLPMMIAPSWTRSMTQPIALPDVLALLTYCIGHPELAGKHYDIGGPDVMSYYDMLRTTADVLGRRVRILRFPLESPTLSLLWVSLITQTPRELVVPLVESLKHDMVAGDGCVLQKQAGIPGTSFSEAMHNALRDEGALAEKPVAERPALPQNTGAPGHVHHVGSSVVSVQRFLLPHGRDAAWVADEYARWLPQFMRPILRVEVMAGRIFRFFVPLMRTPLLQLSFAPKRSEPTRQLFYVTGGMLAQTPQPEPGRFEFREALEKRFVLAAIHDFAPRLPWFLYSSTQAIAHLIVMRGFARHLKRVIDAR